MPSFPTFTAGESVHLPFSQGVEFWNVINRQPHGYQYAYNIRASPLKRWEIEFSFSDTDLATMLTFWDTVKGSYGEFDFTDPDTGATTNKCRFDQETLDVRYVGPNENIVSVVIQEYA